MTTTPIHLVPVFVFIWYSTRLVPILRSSGTYLHDRPVPMLSSSGTYLLFSSGTCSCVSLVLIYMTVCSGTDLCDCVHLVPVFFSSCARLVPVPYLQAWVFERGCSRWVQGIFWLKHSLFIEDHDTFHHSCTLCHEDEIVPLKIDTSTNCNICENI
jgi:hypothetical protein